MRNSCAKFSTASFSLVEVALAMAILAVGMVGVLSLLPVGLDSARQVHNETVATLVARTAIGNIWLSNQASATFIDFPAVQYFDQDGQTNSNPKFQYFRLQITKDPSSATGINAQSATSCRYFLTLEWPKGAVEGTSRGKAVQKRIFVTEALKGR